MAPGQPAIVEVPKPALKPGHALVRPMLEALCGSDVRTIYYAPAHDYPFPPSVGGHEIIGAVQAVDAPNGGIKPGDIALTLVEHDAGMSEYVLTAAENVLPIPDGRPLEHMLMAQQLGTVIFACKHLPNILGKDAVVIGQGSAGLFFNAMLRRLGANRVIALDVIQSRVEAALEFDATHAVNNAQSDALQAVEEITAGELADLVIEAAGELEAINLAPSLLKQGGHIHFFGIPRGSRRIEFDFMTLFRKFCHTTSSGHTIGEPGRTSTRMALELIARGEIDVSPMPTHRFPFERVFEGYELARTRRDGAIKVIIEMPGFETQ
jgi:L-iditol 2-dehydrogenase